MNPRTTAWVLEASDAAVVSGPHLQGGSAVTGGRATGTSNPWLVVVVVCVAQFMVVLDATIVNVESPVRRTYTLGNFFDLWGEKLSASEVGPASGWVTALHNGQVFPGTPGPSTDEARTDPNSTWAGHWSLRSRFAPRLGRNR